jgi:hypothetical protein
MRFHGLLENGTMTLWYSQFYVYEPAPLGETPE